MWLTPINHQGAIKAVDLVQRHLLIVGQTGSGKTTTALGLLSELQQANQTTIVFDPTGEYAKLPNTITYRFGDNAYLDPGNLSWPQLQQLLQLPPVTQLQEQQIEQAIQTLRYQANVANVKQPWDWCGQAQATWEGMLRRLGSWSDSYPVTLLPTQWRQVMVVPDAHQPDYTLLGQQVDPEQVHAAWPMMQAMRTKLHDPIYQRLFALTPGKGVQSELTFVLKMFLKHPSQHRTLVIDLSLLKDLALSQQVVLSVLYQTMLNYRLQTAERFPVQVVLDEAHRYLPTDEHQLAANGLFQVAREGRKVGLTMVVTTQSPLDLPARLRSQFAHQMMHYLGSQAEWQSLGIMQTKLPTLATGQCLIQGLTEQVLPYQVGLPTWWPGN